MTMNDKDTLISRVVDQEAGDADWHALHALAERDPAVWRELAQAQRDHAELTAEIDGALACADRIDVPSHEHFSQSLTDRVRVVVTWSGWVAAAAVVLAWAGLIDLGSIGLSNSTNINTAGVGQPIVFDDPDEAVDQFVRQGREQGFIVGIAPESLILDVAVDDRGEATVIFTRQIIFKEVVDQLYMHPSDERGRPDPQIRYPVILQRSSAIDNNDRPITNPD